MKTQRSSDSNFVIRAFFIHCFMHIYQIIKALDPTHYFKPPRFDLFQKIKKKYNKGHNSLFKNLLITFKWHILRAAVITCIFVSFNLLVPELIKMFMHFMHGHHSEKSEVKQASVFIRNLVGVQVLRIIFGEHSRRIFHELAIKIESTLSKMLVQKSLYLNQKARKDIPQSEILQLENVDLKLVFTMFNNMIFLFEAPLTIFVALIMLFAENRTYGFIGLYWFFIVFLVHRELDEKMTHCNATKLGLIEKRSKINYEMLFGMKEAKMIGWEDVMIEKNNDLFEEENHDHYLFYFYNSLYDIILLMLPVLVVVTICIVDINKANPITVEQVYLMLSLLGICFEPMKSIRTISISFHDGLHSLNRIQQYFDMPEESENKNFITNDVEVGHLVIEKDTASNYPGVIFDFFVKVKNQIEAGPGDRLVVLGRKGQGSTAFLNMINGFMEKIQGGIKLNGKKACITDNFFFMKSTVKENIIFYNEHISPYEIDKVCEDLDITEELKKYGGLQYQIEDTNNMSKSLLKRISLARVLCSEADIYILDRPFEFLEDKHVIIVEKILRSKQEKERILIILTMNELLNADLKDKMAIVSNGVIEEYGTYDELINNENSQIKHYFKSSEDKLILTSPDKKITTPLLMKNKFKSAVRKITTINNAVKGLSVFGELNNTLRTSVSGIQNETDVRKSFLFSRFDKVLESVLDIKSQNKIQENSPNKLSFKKCLRFFILAVPIVEIFFIMIIIACAELLHVFIHFFIGHEIEANSDFSYLNFKSLIVVEVLLTLGLAGVLYYEGEVSSMIAIIQGNEMYKNSLFSLIRKSINYFVNEYPVRIADRFNHDYEEVFIACHGLLTIYKNIIILAVTVIFISSDGFTVITFFTVIICLYTAIYLVFRKVQNKVIEHYYDFKYGFVQCFEESLQGAEYLGVFGSRNHLIKRAEKKYKKLASYKLAERYTNHGLSIACDIIGNILLASIVYVGLESKIHQNRSNIALMATSIHLLMNGSQVIKNILKETINFETFFCINLVPFAEMINESSLKQNDPKDMKYEKPIGYEARFDGLVLTEPGKIKSHALNFKVREKEHILIYESNETFRNMILYAFSNNLEESEEDASRKKNSGSLLIGNANIKKMDPEQILKMVGVIMSKNFYFSGTLRENLIRKIIVDEEEILEYITDLKLDEDIEDFDLKGLDSEIHFDNRSMNYEITKKFALLRILLYKSKIVIIKDTPSFVGSISIVDLLKKHNPECTIIKIDNRIESAFGVDRIIHMENSIILEEGNPKQLMAKPTSSIGSLLKDSNMDDYLFKNQVSRAKATKRFSKFRHI